MGLHWRSLDPAGKAEAIRAIYEPGMSSRQIGEYLGVTKNAVVALYTRNPELLKDVPLQRRGGDRGTPGGRAGTGRPAGSKPKPVWETFVPRNAAKIATVGRPMLRLGEGQCRWPVNDATPQQEHLFCGLPSRGSYCDHHAARAVRLDRGEG